MQCNSPVELNQHRGFKVKDHRCRCGGSLQAIYSCRIKGVSPARIPVTVNNTHQDYINGGTYFDAWRDKRRMNVFLIDSSGKFSQLKFEEHNLGQ